MRGELDLRNTQIPIVGNKIKSPVAISLSPEGLMDRKPNSKITSTMLASFSSRDSNNLNGLGFSDPQLVVNTDLI